MAIRQNTASKRGIAINLSVLLGCFVYLVVLVPTPEDAIRARNSFISEVIDESDTNWSPADVPQDFLLEELPIPARWSGIVESIAADRDDAEPLEKALRIARHLVEEKREGGEVMGNALEAYETIRNEGRGYCADYAQVFSALALASDIFVREWGLSFSGFGGDGHAFNEIYDETRRKWVLIDSFNAFYVVDTKTNSPLSVAEFRKRLKSDGENDTFSIVRIVPEKFGFKSDDQLKNYYRSGADQFYLWKGNNVFSYDANPVVSILAKTSRSLEQGSGILVGVYPGIWLLQGPDNQQEIEELHKLRLRLLLVMVITVISVIVMLLQLVWRLRRKLH